MPHVDLHRLEVWQRGSDLKQPDLISVSSALVCSISHLFADVGRHDFESMEYRHASPNFGSLDTARLNISDAPSSAISAPLIFLSGYRIIHTLAILRV